MSDDPAPPERESPEPSRRRKRRKRKSRKSGATAAVALTPREVALRRAGWTALTIVLVLGAAAALITVVYPSRSGPGTGRDVELTVVGDESPAALAGRLNAAGLIANPTLFAAYVRLSGGAEHVAHGAHLLTDDLSPREVLNRLERRGAATHARVTIPEGWTRFDIAKRLQANHVCTQKAFLDATEDPNLLTELHVDGPSLEGFLFPATYDLASDSEPGDVIRRLKAEFDKRWFSLEQRHPYGVLDLSQTLHWGMREVVTLASIIEKEAAVEDERRTIASVFLNRLRDPNFKKKVLQSDPTAGYGCLVAKGTLPSCANFTGRITHDVNADPDNAYSTYTHEGLPPGPICNPGAHSIEAVMSPALTHFLFFVAKGDGHHSFSDTYEGHMAAVKDSGPRK
jgi:UPF0755 protein